MSQTTAPIQVENKSLLKIEVRRILVGVSRRDALQRMYKILIDSRKVPFDEAKNIKSLHPPEIKAVLKSFGFIE